MVRVTIDNYLVIRAHLVNVKDLWVRVATLAAILIRCMRLVVCIPLHAIDFPDEVVIVKFSLELVFRDLRHTLADSL